MGLPPADLVIARPEPLGAGDLASPPSPDVTSVPNPLPDIGDDPLRGRIRGPRSRGGVRCGGDDRCALLADGLEARNGWNTLSWDATDGTGSPVAPGAYWAAYRERSGIGATTGGEARRGVTMTDPR